MTGPLQDIRVLELGQVVAGPDCGQVLAGFGADVVKVEPPGVGHVLRQWGWAPEGKDSLWFRIAARGKRSITLDLRTEQGQSVVRRLAREVDVVVENFQPGTLERWGLGDEALSGDNSGLVLVRISGFGQDGPYSSRPGYASIGEAKGGLRAPTGFPDRPSVRVGLSFGDTLTGLMGALGALAVLHERQASGRKQVVDAAIYESVLCLTERLVPKWSIAGLHRERTGPVLKGIAPSNVYPAADGEVLITANQNSLFRRLCEVMGVPELADDPRFELRASPITRHGGRERTSSTHASPTGPGLSPPGRSWSPCTRPRPPQASSTPRPTWWSIPTSPASSDPVQREETHAHP